MQETTPESSQLTNKLDPVILELFKKRGFETQDILDFLSWDLKKLPELKNLKDLERGAARIVEALEQQQTIGIYGDYDVDGTTSCALLYHFFQSLGVEVITLQPSRFVEGYGLHPESIDQAIEKGIELLVTVDCGITNNEAASYAKKASLDLIITDHHKDIKDEMPEACAVINPSRRDEPNDHPLKPLAGVGVAFCLALQVRELLMAKGQNIPSLYPLLPFVAIGTVCDLVPLTPMNLKLVRHGLKQMIETPFCGIRAFFNAEERKLPHVSSEKLSFNIGPMINSKGRLDHPERALSLLLADDSDEAYSHYSHLEVCNKERKRIQHEVFSEAKDQVVKQMDGKELIACIVFSEHWHEGVIGIVASKLVESFKVPAIVFTEASEEGIIKASARAAGELSIFDCLKEFDHLFLKFGGHKAAAGLSMPKENFSTFKTGMLNLLNEIPAIERTQPQWFDLDIDLAQINPRLVKNLELLEPFGTLNPKPRFRSRGVKLASYDLMKEIHVRWNFQSQTPNAPSIRGVSFNYLHGFGNIHPEELFSAQRTSGEDLTIYYTLGINRFRGNEYIQLMVDSVSLGDY
jgi:single-stranded-DNA-specific exonuclease